MKKLILSFSIIITFGLYAFFINSKSSSSPQLSSGSDLYIVPPQSMPNGVRFENGDYTGTIEDVYYGNVQIKAVISNNQLSDVVFLQYPKEKDNSVKISQRAMPILRSEAIKSQSADVDIVSGATETSSGFRKSLGNALAQAQKAQTQK